jgi:hypothetical protein
MKTHALPATLLFALLVCPAAAQAPLPKMELHLQCLDGNAADVVGPEVSNGSVTERVWGLQGRRREVWEVSTRERQHDEEDKDFATRLAWGAIDLVGGAPNPQDRLFTLTQRQVQKTETGETVFPAVIKVDRIANPSAPETLQVFTFSEDERPTHICTIPDADKLIVLMGFVPGPPFVPSELRIYDYSSGVLPDPLLPPLGVAQIPSGVTECSQGLKNLIHAQVEEIGQQRMALISATVDDPVCVENVQAAALVVCNVENPANPLFYADDLYTQTWQPCRPVPPPPEPCLDWRFEGLTHVRTTDMKDLVYVVGGADVQLTELDVTNVAIAGIGIVEEATYPVNSADLLFQIAADPEAPGASDYLYIIGRQYAYVVDRAHIGSPGSVKSTAAGFGNGPAGDVQFMLADPTGTPRREIWSLAMQQARYVFRVTDFTQDADPTLEFPDTSEGYHSAGPTDGAVASFGWESVYVLTFGGVVRYDISGSVPVPAVYQPACDPCSGLGQKDFVTEHLELVNMGTAGSTDWRLIAATAEGSFFEWPLDPVTHEPLEGELKHPPAGYWDVVPPWQGATYGNDIVTWTPQPTGDKWVFIDYSDTGGADLGIGRYNWSTDSWPVLPTKALVWHDPTPMVLPNITPNIRDLAAEGEKWLLAAANGGFLVVDVLTWQVTDFVYTNAVQGVAFANVQGIEKYGNRIFASLGDGTNRFALAMYAFDPGTGHVVGPTGGQTDAPIQVLFDGSAGKPDHFPGVFLDGGERMSLIETKANPKELRLYSGTQNGNLLEIGWKASTDTMTPLSYWHNGGYFNSIASCDVYKDYNAIPAGFGPSPLTYTLRVVVGKTLETFEIVTPPDMP